MESAKRRFEKFQVAEDRIDCDVERSNQIVNIHVAKELCSEVTPKDVTFHSVLQKFEFPLINSCTVPKIRGTGAVEIEFYF